MLYIVKVYEEGEQYEYEYGNLDHACEHYNNEKNANLYRYEKGSYYFIEGKETA